MFVLLCLYSSSFPVPTRGKGKKSKKQPTRKIRKNQQKDHEPSDDVNDQVASKNAQNSLLNALQSEALGRGPGTEVKGKHENALTDSSMAPSAVKDPSIGREGNLLEILDEGSFGISKDCTERLEEPSEIVPGESDSLPGNTELVADIFGVSPSVKSQEEEETQLEIVDDNYANDPDHAADDEEVQNAPGPLESNSSSAKKNPVVRQPQEEKENLKSVQRSQIPADKHNSQMPHEDDPYEFIASQRTPKKVKSKCGRKGKKQVPAASKSKKSGKKQINQSQSVVGGKKKGAVSKGRQGKESIPTGTEIIIIDEDEGQETDANKTKSADLETTNARKKKLHEQETVPQTDEHQDEAPLFDDDNNDNLPLEGDDTSAKKDLDKVDPTEESGNMRIEGLFASQATNDSIDPNEDRGLPLYDYDESSDEEAVDNSDQSYKPGGRVLRRRGIQMESSSRRITRRQKEPEECDADESSTSAGEGGLSLRKRKNVKPYERKSRQKKQISSDSSSSTKENLEKDGEKVEAEMSFIQDHLEECDDVDLYLDGDSQRPHIDKEERHQKLKNVTTRGKRQKQQQEVVVGDGKGERVDDKLLENESTKSDERKTKSSVTDKAPANVDQDGNELIVIEDDESHADEEDTTSLVKTDSLTKETSNTFKKPSTNAVRKNKPPSKSKSDYVTISMPSLRQEKKKKLSKTTEGKHKQNHSRPLQDPDGEELTIEDSQRERKERNPGGAQVFFKSYKRGSIRIDRSLNDDVKEDEDDDDDITLADVFGNDDVVEDDLLREHRSDGGEDNEEMPMDTSDVQDDDEDLLTPMDQQNDVAVVTTSNSKDKESLALFEKKGRKDSRKQDQNLPPIEQDVPTEEDNVAAVIASNSKDQEPSALFEKKGRKDSKKQDQNLPPVEHDVPTGDDSRKTTRHSSRNRSVRSKSKSSSERKGRKEMTMQEGENLKDTFFAEGSSRTTSKGRESPIRRGSRNAEITEDNVTEGKQSKSQNRSETDEKDVVNQSAEEISPRKSRSRSREKKGTGKAPKGVLNQVKDGSSKLVDSQDITNLKDDNLSNDDPVRQNKSSKEKDDKQKNDVPAKSDWEVALELAREFGTEPKQFRSRSLQRASDETGGRRSSRERSRRKKALSLENVSATNSKANENQNQCEIEDVQEIGSFSTEDSQSLNSTPSEKIKLGKSGKKQDSQKKKNSKKSSKSKERHLEESRTKVQPTEQQSKSNKLMDSEGVEGKKRSASGKQSSQSKERKTVIPETPLLPDINCTDSALEESIVTSRRGKKQSLQKRSSLSPQTVKDVKSLGGESKQNMPPAKDTPETDNKSATVLEVPQLNSAEATNINSVVDAVVEDSEVVSRCKKRQRSAKLNDSSDDDICQAKTEDIQLSGRKTRQSAKQIDSSESSDDDMKEVERSSERSSGRKYKKITAAQEIADAKTSDHEMLISETKTKSQTPGKQSKAVKRHRSQRLQRLPGKDNNDSTITEIVDSQQEKLLSEANKRPSRSRRLRSKRGHQRSQSSDPESTDQDGSRSRERRSKSQDPLSRNRTPIPLMTRPLRKSRRGTNLRSLSSESESTGRESSKSRERVVKSQNTTNRPLTPEPVRKSGRRGQSISQTPVKDSVSISKVQSPSVKSIKQQKAPSDSKYSSTPDLKKSKSTRATTLSTRNSPRLSASDQKLQGDDVVSVSVVNSDALFSEEETAKEEKLSKEDEVKKTAVGKESDTTESIELAVSNEEYELENPGEFNTLK